MGSVNEMGRYMKKPSLIGQAHTENDLWINMFILKYLRWIGTRDVNE